MAKSRWIHGTVFTHDGFSLMDLTVEDGIVTALSPSSSPLVSPSDNETIVDCHGMTLFPGFVDLHVHFREPGFSYKETIETGTRAAAHGGYTVCCTMPNLKPVSDSPAHLETQRALIRETALVHVLPYGAISVDEKGKVLTDFEALAPYVVGFSDDGVGVADAAVMREAMQRARAVGKPIVAHAEDLSLVSGGVIHDGAYAAAHHHKGNPSASEWTQVERDLRLVKETGARYHICHISTKESVALLRKAKADDLPVSGETAPHYLTLTDADLQEDGRFKMNPPVREATDREALIAALADGTLVAVATDHAPHAAEEKAKGLDHSANGIVGLETAFSVLYTTLVRTGKLPLERLIDAMALAPREALALDAVQEARPGRGIGHGIAVGEPADFSVWDLDATWRVQPETFLSKGRATPFAGWTLYGLCGATCVAGKPVYVNAELMDRRTHGYI
ncbi:MAG: dihydroorotase [Peptoniphilaceae bacterium]|nr:dihydroorotase [Peptoniphilaceae bacterium]MDY6085795.1 dihydroorotase [Peptoniphilaceae bacterium]